jgi:arsenite-transporting ATPase
MFGGKGGVGKTTSAAAEAVRRAEEGKRVLVVSTDPAHSLGDALAMKLEAAPRRIGTRRGELLAVELDADRALDRWLEEREPVLREIASRGTYLDDEDIESLFRLSLPGVDELVGLLELRRLASGGPWDEVIVDTAPTGHTMRLLETPDALRRIAQVLDDMLAKHRFLAASLGGRHRVDRTDELASELAEDAESLKEELRDPARTSFVWVLVPEAVVLEETRRGLARLVELGVHVGEVRINRVTPAPERACDSCSARVRGEGAILAAACTLAPRVRIAPACDEEPRGVPALRALAARVGPCPWNAAARPFAKPRPARAVRRAPEWLDTLAPRGVRLVIVGGKGGVGKTSAAAAIALRLAARDKVLLLSADPAHSLGDVLGVPLGDEPRRVAPRLFARELDADGAFAAQRKRYRDAVDEIFARILRGPLDAAYDRAVVEDLIDLAPPGIDELFAVLALTDALFGNRGGAYDAVVLDTAPTGHTLRLLALPDAALEWVHALMKILLKYKGVLGLGDMAQDLVDAARKLKALVGLLHDRARTRFVPVSRAGAVVRAETERLVLTLRARGIPLAPVLVNAETPPGARLCRRCAARAKIEAREARVLARTARDMLFAPLVYPPPRSPQALREWSDEWHLSSTSTRS